MSTPRSIDSPPAVWRAGIAATIVALLGVAVMAALYMQRQIESTLESRLEQRASVIASALEQRMVAYVQVLRGGLGFFAGSTSVTRDDWVRYVDDLRLSDSYPGFKSLSFARAVPDDQLADFVAAVRAEPLPDGLVDPAYLTEYTPRSPTGVPSYTPLHSPILYVAPFSAENQLVLGVDMMQDPTRRAVMERAAATSDAALTPRLRLASQDDERAGFIAYLAVRLNGELYGWLTAAFRAEDFMDGILGSPGSDVEFEILDDVGGLLHSTAGIYATGGPMPLSSSTTDNMSYTAKPRLPASWTVNFYAGAHFETTADNVRPWVVAAGGLLVTALVAAIGWTGAGWRRRAVQLVAQREALQRSEAAVRHQATHDALTGLPNRAQFHARLEAAVAGTPFALAYIDIDRFKTVNDTLGHHVGDSLLVAIAERIRRHIDISDVPARLGGDEFAIIVAEPDSPPHRAVDLCDKLTRALAQPFTLDIDGAPVTVSVGASIGISFSPGGPPTADALVRAADTAMLQAKRTGRGRWCLAEEDTILT